MADMQELLGEELYNQVAEKVGDKKIDVVSDGSYFPKEKFDAVNTELKQYKQQVADRDEQLDNLKQQNKGNENLQATIDELKENNKQEKERLQEESRQLQYSYELDIALRESNARNPKAVMGLLDTENIKLDEDGKLKGLSEQVEDLKESDAYLFNDESQQTDDNNTQPQQQPQQQQSYKPGQTTKTNNPAPTNKREAGRARAMERYGLNKKEEE